MINRQNLKIFLFFSVFQPREKGRMRFHRLQNVQIALDFLKQRQVKLVNIRNDDITDGNPKLTLGLIWTIILHFQISEIYVSGESGDLTAKEKLLLWSQQATEGWPGLRCTNFSSSWSNGHMFNALLHRFRPDLIDMEVVAQQSNLDNLEQAFEIAESLGVTRLLDAEDVDVPSPDEKSVITYVSSIYDAFPKIPEGGEGIAAHEVDHRWAEYRSRFSTLLQWSRQHKALMANKNFPLNPVELKALYNEYVHFKETEIPAKELEKSSIERLYKLLEVWMEFGRIKLPLGLHPNDLEEEWGKLILEMLEREKALRPADMSLVESGEAVRCERELGLYLQDCEALIRQLNLDLNVLRDEKYYQVEQLAFRSVEGEGGVGQLVEYIACNARKASSIPGTTHKSKIYARMTDVLERAEWGADLPSVEQNLQDHHNIHTAVEELLHSLKEARNYETKVSPNFRSSYSDTLAKLEHQYCKLLEHSSWRLRCLESLHAFVCCCTEELIWLNEREEEELAYDWSQNNTNINAKRELYAEMRSELEEKQEVMHSLQETADRLCQENHPAKQTVEAYSAALQTQWQWVRQLCVCVEQHLKDNTAYFQFVSDARDCETYLRQLQDTIKRQYTCDKSSRLGKLEDLLQDSMEEKEQLIEYRSSVASLVGRAKTVVQLRPRSTESTLGSTTPIRAICDYRQIEITISRGEECVLGDNSQRTKWKVISPSGNEAMVPSVCFTVPPPNQEAMDTASRMEQLYQSVMSLWHNLHVNMKSVVSWHYLQKDISTVSSWSLDTVRHTVLTQRAHLADFLSDSKESALFTPTERRELEREAHNAQEHCQDLLVNMETGRWTDTVSQSQFSSLFPEVCTCSLPYLDLKTNPYSRCQKLQSDLDGLRISLGEVSRRCVSFFEEKPTSSSVPVLRSELNLAVEKIDRLHNLSSVYLHKLKTVDMLMYSLQAAESQVKRYESRLSEEDIVPADTNAIQALREQLGTWQSELEDQEGVFSSLQSAVQEAREAGTQLNKLHPDRSPELERYQERAAQLTERWAGVKRQMDTRHFLIKVEQVTRIHICVRQDYELQLMTFRAFVESTQKSTGKRRRMHSSSDAITQEFMDLRTRYTALVTLTTQHVKYISDALRRLEEEEVLYVSLFFIFFFILSSGFFNLPLSVRFIAVSEQLAAKKEEVAKVIRNTQVFLMSKQASKRKFKYSLHLFLYLQSQSAIGGVIDLGTMETIPVFKAAQRGLIDLDTCHVLLEAQLTMGGLFQPDSPVSLSLEEGLNCGLIDSHISQSLSELESALHLVDQTEQLEGQLLPVAAAMEAGLIKEEVGLRILELQINTGGLRELGEGRLTLNSAGEMGLLSPRVYTKLGSRVNRRELIDPNTADKLNLDELQQRCILSNDTGLYLLPVKQQPGGTVCLRSGRKVGIFRAVQEGLIDRQVTVRLLEAQLFAGGISDPRSGHLLTVNEAVHHNLMDQDLACAMLTRQLQSGGILDPVTGDRLGVEEAIQKDLLSPHLALLVLESLWAFIGMLWPESGELLPIAEALQQGVISGELAWNILRQRHAIGALYLPETPKVVSLNQAKEVLEPKVAEILKEIQIPDVLHNMNQSGSPKLNRLIRGSTGTSHPPSSSPASSPGLNCDPSFLEKMAPEEQAHHRLLFHLMTHSYVDAHSGQRLVLLEPELVELVKAAAGLINVDRIPGVVEEGLSLITERQECMEVVPDVSLPDTPQTREIGKVQEKSAIFSLPEKYIYSRNMVEEADNQGWDGTPDILEIDYTTCNPSISDPLHPSLSLPQEVQKDLLTRGEGVAETIRSVEEFLAEHGDSLSPEERANLQGALSRMKEQYSALTNTAQSSLAQLDTAISTTVQQNTQRVRVGLFAELQQLQAQQAQLMQVSQNARSLLDQPDSAVPAKEKRRLRDQLDQLQTQHQEKLRACQERLRRSEALKDELAKFLQEHGGLGTWLEQSEGELCSLGEGETDAQGLKGRLEEHKKVYVVKYIYIFLNTSPLFQKLRQELLSRQGSVEATCDSVSKLLQSSDASTASGLQRSLESLTQSYAAAQAKQAEREAELRGLLPKLENYERLSTDLQGFTQTCLRALSPAGQPDRSVEDYRQTIEVRGGMLDISFVSVIFSFYISNSCYCFSLKRSLPIYLDSRWAKANEAAVQRQVELETCADRLGSFATAASQLGPWLKEKELMMSVLGPLSIDPNMLNTQNQQVQFMLREFETRRPQFDQLTQAAEGILSPSGGDSSPQDAKDLAEVRSELGSISQQWDDLTQRLSQRSEHIDQAQGTSQRYQALLKNLSVNVGALGERLDGQASLSAQPEALKRRLQETGEIRSELEQRREELGEAEKLCGELSAIVVEPYLRDELKKRLESVSGPLRTDGLSQLQAALSSTQQFQQMFKELRSWLDNQSGQRDSTADSLPCQPEAIRTLLAQQDELHRGVASQRGPYELIQAEGASLLASLPTGGEEQSALLSRLTALRRDWDELNQCITERQNRLKSALTKAESYQQHRDELTPWVAECEEREADIQPSLDPAALDEALQKARQLGLDLERRRPLLEALNTVADQLLEHCRVGEEDVRDEKAQLNRRVDGLAENLQNRVSQLEELVSRLKEFEDGRQAVERRLEAARHQIEVQEALGPQACSNKSLERLRSQQETLHSLQPQVAYLRDLAQGLVQDTPHTEGGGGEGGQRLEQQIEKCCSTLESRLQGVGEVQSSVRDLFSHLADLDDELDSLSPVGRDADSLASQADAVHAFLARLATLRSELEGHGGDCTAMLRREGSSPDLLALRRETEALSRQAGKLSERGQARLGQIEVAAEKVGEFYAKVAELQGLLGRAEEGLNAQGVVGTEVETIKQQLHEFKQVDSIQPKLQRVNAVGQGLIQSAAKHTDTQALEHDLEATNLRWNSLNKRVAERIAQLQEALLHCGKFQDALEPLLSWLSDTEELVANQKPPSVEYRVVKAQIQEQKLLQRLLDDRRATFQMIQGEGERIAATAETQDRDKIQKQLESLGERWGELLEKARARQCQLEELQTLALQFHEAVEPLGEWLSATERRLSTAEPMGTQTSKITQQITKHKVTGAEVDRLEALGQSLAPLSCAADRDWLGERVGAVRLGHSELSDWCQRRAVMLEQALANAELFGEDEVEVLNWLAEVGQRLGQVSVQSYQPGVLTQQHKHTLSLNEEIVSRKKQVDQAIKNGQALLKQTTGEEVLLIQEKLDGIKSRYAEMTAGSSKALRTLEQALQLSTRFASAHDDLNQWLDKVEAELNVMEPDATPAYQDRQKVFLTCVSAEKRLVLDTVNEVGNALLDLVPWRAREGLDRLVADANQRYRTADETITQRVKLVQAAIQRSQQYEEAVDAELTWAGETERKLSSLGPLSLEPDVTVAQLQVQRAFNIDIIRHKDTVDQLLNTRDDILETCSDQQRDSLLTESLSARYEAVSQQHQERFSALEQAQVLVARFWETQEDLEPWLGETETLIAQLPPPAIDTEALRLQQEQMRLLRESIAEHKPHIDKLLKIGPQLAALSHQEGATVRQRYSDAEKRYVAIKEVIKGRATTLDEAVSQSAQFHDKMDPLLETLEGAVQRLRSPPPVAAEADKIREQLADHKATGLDLDKLLPSFSALCARGEELINRAAHDDPAAQDIIRYLAEEREGKLTDVLDLAGKFWADMAALLSTLRDSQDIVKELEDPGVDPSLIKQQIEAAEAIKAETDGLREELEFVRTLGADLIFACGETEKPEVKKTIDEMNAAWEGLNRTWRERMERLEEAMTASVQYQDALQSMFDYLDNAVIKLCDMSTVGTDLGTVKQQIDELKQYKVEVYQQQIDMEKLCHQGELLLKKVSDQTDRDMIQEPLTELRHLWDNLGDKITHRQHKLEGALLALGQFQHALSELQSWLSHTHATLDTQRPINSDPKAIEIELAKHHVLRNDVLSHRSTVETVNAAGAELLESSPGDEANHLRDQLDHLNRGWENLLLKTQDRQKLLEAALHQAEGFHGELEEFLQWLRRTESQLSAAKPTGGLPETAREQLQQHLELQTQLAQRAEQYNRLLDAGESMLLSRGGEEGGPGAGTTQTQQNLALLQNKWASLNTKMDDRRAKLDEAVSLATGFQSSLQDTINWLTQAEQTLNMAQPPSLILDTVLFQIDEHKVFVNEVNTHREQVLALEKAGSQLRFASIKQDVVLIKNLLLSVQARWDKLVQRSLDRGRHLDEARKRAKQFHEAWRKLSDWLEEAESRLDSELEISNEPDKIKEFHFKALGSKQPVYDTTVRSGKAMRDKATLPEDTQKLDHLLGEVRDKWDTVCGKSVERQHKLEEALLFSGQFAEALQALVDWLYRVEPQLAEDLPVHGDLDLVSNLMDSHKAFQKELGKRTTSVHALKRSARELMETGRDDTAWVKVQLQELSNRWDTVCALSVTKQTRLQQAFKQAEEFRTAVHLLLEWLSEAEQTLRFRGVLPEEAETLQTLLHTHRNFMATVEEKRTDVNRAAGQGEAILTACQADCITTIKHWITIIRARFEEVLTWAKQHEQRLETALTELLNNATLLEELLSWLQWAETTLVQRDGETLPQDIPQLKTLITEHQVFMEEMTRKQPDVDKVTKTYKRKPAEAPSSLAERRGVAGGNPRLTQLCSRWQQVWLLALDRQRKLNDALDRLEELKEFASFDFDVWRKRYMRWMNHKKSRVMDFFRRIDKDQDGKITRQEFIDGILASKFPTSRLEMTAVADIFDQDGDGYIDYYEFVAALHPNKDAYRPTTDADKIEDEVTRQVAQCKCAKRFQVEQIGENKYRFFLGNQFGDSQQLRLVRILRSTVMVRVGGGWMALDEFLVKNDPCRARGRTNLELREKFILPEGASQGLAAFRSRGRRSKPGSRTASPTRSSSSASHSAHSCASLPSTPSSNSRGYAKPWLAHSKTPTPTKCQYCPDHDHTTPGLNILFFSIHFLSLITYPPPFSLSPPLLSDPRRTPSGASGAASRAGSRAGSRASSRRGSDASDASELLETHSACSDTSDTPRRPGAAKPSKIPTISKKAPSPKTPTSGKK
uniref:Microtubule actin crosslinking factor 1 n=1 Tax=Hucho hucho TaxID=62062 RepID=A0A4W5Q0N5_9TELE